MDHYKDRCEKETPVEDREELLKRLQDAMLNTDSINGKVFSEIDDLHNKLLKMQEALASINGSVQTERN